MSPKTLSVATLSRLSAVLVGLIALAGCGGGSSSSSTSSASPAVTLSANTLTFSTSQSVGTSSAAQSVTVTNSGSATLTFSSIAVSGDFSQSNTCGTSIGASGACTVSVTFTPTAAGTRTGTLTITDNASNSPQTVSLTGTGAVPTVSLSTSTLTFGSQTVGTSSAPQPVTVNSTGASALSITSIVASGDFSETNNCGTSVSAGTSCTINVTFTPTAPGTRNGTLTITDNASTSPQTVSLTGTGAGSSVSLSTNTLTFAGLTVGSSSAAQPVTLTDTTGSGALTVSSITVSGDFSQTNNCPLSPSSLVGGGSCTINVTFTPTAGGTRTGTLTITDNAEGVAGSTQTVGLTGTGLTNAASVSVNFGPNGNTGSSSTNYYNGIFTTVTICAPGSTANCATIPNVLVDTGSVGLRVLSTELNGLTLQTLTDTSGDALQECIEYGDLTYTWGPVQWATVQIGGETASQVPAAYGGTANSGVPIQVISAPGTGVTVPSGISCASGGGGDDNTVASLGANGILGVGNYPQDCGVGCTSQTLASQVSPYPYFLCGTAIGGCAGAIVPVGDQVWNPVAAFSSSDTNGVVLTLSPITAPGQATVTGTLSFGIGTETNNAIPSGATVYELDDYGNFASALFYGVTYTSANSYGSFLDSGSNALFVSDPTTLTSLSAETGVASVVNCTDNGYYCPSSTLTLNITNYGSNGTSGPVTLSIANADLLFSTNPNFAAFNNLGATSGGTGTSTDSFDLGLPFFFGQTIFVGIAGTSTTYPNGYWAF